MTDGKCEHCLFIMLSGKYDCADEGIRKQVMKAFEGDIDWHVGSKPSAVNYQIAYHGIHADKLRY